MGGHIHRHFSRILDSGRAKLQTKKTSCGSCLKRLRDGQNHRVGLEETSRRDAAEFERIRRRFARPRLVNSERAFIEVNADPTSGLIT